MRIAQVAPLWERVPPPAYGGIELVVGLLTDELVRRGHEVTLFATGDSQTLAQLESVYPRAIRLDPRVKDYGVYEALQLNEVYQRAGEFDLIHSHMGYVAVPHASLVKTPTLHTLHGAFTDDDRLLFARARQQYFVSISDAQREPLPELNYMGTVYNAIATEIHPFSARPQDPPYLAFLGRMSPQKGPHLAIAIAKQSGIPLKMAGKVDEIDRDYFEEAVKPHLDGEFIQFLGEANHEQKTKLLGGACAMLFPITWREPFGLVMIESMAAGTPVIAMGMGSTPEVIVDGKTGFICHSVEECVAAVSRLETIDREECRRHVERNFSVQRMVDGYEAAYRCVLGDRFALNGHSRSRLELVAS